MRNWQKVFYDHNRSQIITYLIYNKNHQGHLILDSFHEEHLILVNIWRAVKRCEKIMWESPDRLIEVDHYYER